MVFLFLDSTCRIYFFIFFKPKQSSELNIDDKLSCLRNSDLSICHRMSLQKIQSFLTSRCISRIAGQAENQVLRDSVPHATSYVEWRNSIPRIKYKSVEKKIKKNVKNKNKCLLITKNTLITEKVKNCTFCLLINQYRILFFLSLFNLVKYYYDYLTVRSVNAYIFHQAYNV